MKVNGPVSGKECIYNEDINIVSTTDLKGRITYTNNDFISVSGYSEDELINKSHNIVRHPDMPPAAFADLWKTMQAGDTWLGIVNNLCKNGDHYWVDAFVAPVYQNGQIVGYQSVRTKPNRERIDRADKLYKKLNANKLNKYSFSSIGYTNKIFLATLASLLPLTTGVVFTLPAAWIGVCVFASITIAFIGSKMLGHPIVKAAKSTDSVINNSIARYIYSGRTDEIGQLQTALHMQTSRLRTLIGRVSDVSGKLIQVTEKTSLAVEKTSNSIQSQNSETDQVAAAINELATTSQEVAHSIESVAQSAISTSHEAEKIKDVVSKTMGSISQLGKQVEQASSVINKLDEDSNSIEKILDVIHDVAEQTNLLALNAAIEAARAGDAGRGFAVVADEVRTLASRTAQSTEEIQNMITQLQASAKNAVKVMNIARDYASDSVNYVGKSGESLNIIATSVATTSDMNAQIATAAEEQSAVTEEVNRNIHNISSASASISGEAQQTFEACQELSEMAHELQNVVKQCKF